MSTLVIVTSPLQAKNAIAYLDQQGTPASSCVIIQVRSGQPDDNKNTRAVIATKDWRKFHSVAPYRSLSRSALGTRVDSKTATDVWKLTEHQSRALYHENIANIFDIEGTDFDTVVLGDYRPASFRQFLTYLPMTDIDVILVDDGSITPSVMRARNSGRFPTELTRGIPESLGRKDPFDFFEPSSIKFFTIYENEELAQTDEIVRNEVYDGISQTPGWTIKDEYWICGANHVEAGIAKEAAYIRNCQSISQWLPNSEIKYFPHRREDPSKLEFVKTVTGCSVMPNDQGIENYVMSEKVAPKAVFLFGSTVADTLSRIFPPETLIVLVLPKPTYFASRRRHTHIAGIIKDNIRGNPRVYGVDSDGQSLKAWFENSRPAQTSYLEVATKDAGNPEYLSDIEKVENFTSKSTDTGWTSYKEKGGSTVKNLHRIHFAPALCPVAGKGLLRAFRIKSEGRSVFRFRITIEGSTENLDVQFDCNKPGIVFGESEFGKAVIVVGVDEKRISTVYIFFARTKPKQVLKEIGFQQDGPVTFTQDLLPEMGPASSIYLGKEDSPVTEAAQISLEHPEQETQVAEDTQQGTLSDVVPPTLEEPVEQEPANVKFQLITQDASNAVSSFHLGRTWAGFSLSPALSPTPNFSDNHTARHSIFQCNMEQNGVGISHVTDGKNTFSFLLHDGIFDALNVDAFYSTQKDGSDLEIPILAVQKIETDLGLRKSSPVVVSREEECIRILSNSEEPASLSGPGEWKPELRFSCLDLTSARSNVFGSSETDELTEALPHIWI